MYDILERMAPTAAPPYSLRLCSSGGTGLKAPYGRAFIPLPSRQWGARFGAAPATLDTPPTRFNAACFGCLGYELDLKFLSWAERREIKDQIAFYKKHRRTFQYGRFYRLPPVKDNKVYWQCVGPDMDTAIAGLFQAQAEASEGYDFLPLTGLDPGKYYTLTTRPQSLFLKRFGGLVNHLLPFTLDPNGFILRTVGKFYCLTDCVEKYEGYGDMLMSGVRLNNQFMGTWYNSQTRLLGDFGSNLYVLENTRSLD